jgi:hypothetical protein
MAHDDHGLIPPTDEVDVDITDLLAQLNMVDADGKTSLAQT